MSSEEKNNQTENTQPEIESNAARVLRARGTDITPPPEDTAPLKGNRFSNFWYHHKWKVIITCAFAFIFATLAVQFANKSNPDITILYAGPVYMTPNQAQDLSRCLYDVMDDFNGDGEKKVEIHDIIYLTDNQYEKAKAEADAAGEDFYLNIMSNAQTADQFNYEIIAGESLLCLLAEDQYREAASLDVFVPLTELGLTVPENMAIDNCGIRFSETAFYKFYDAVQVFPEDTILAVRKLTYINQLKSKKKTAAWQENAQDLFAAIVTFSYPEGYVPPQE